MEETETKAEVEIKIHRKVRDTFEWFISNYDQEVNGWLIGEFKEDCIEIEDIIFPHQEVSGGSAETEGKNLARLRKEYGDKCTKIVGHWHSHNTMGAFWSQTDDEFIDQHMSTREKCIFIVSGRDRHLVRLEVRKPFKISLNDLPFKVVYNNEGLDEELQKVLKEKIGERKVETSYWVRDWNDGYSNYRNYDGYGYKYNSNKLIRDYEVDYEKDRGIISFNTSDPYLASLISDEMQHKKPILIQSEGNFKVKIRVESKKEANLVKRDIRDILNAMEKEAIYDEF